MWSSASFELRGASRDVCSFITGLGHAKFWALDNLAPQNRIPCLKLFKGAAAHGDGDVLEEVLEVDQQL